MKRLGAIILLCVVSYLSSGQESKQIRSRKIERVSSKTEQLQKDKKEVSFETTHYDRKGREVLIEYFNADSICFKTEHFEYNHKGKIILHVTNDSTSHKTTSVEQHYDAWNRLIEKMTNENGVITERIVYAYNNFDDKTSEIHYGKDGALKKKTVFAYDKRGMLIRRTTENAEGTIIFDKSIEYEY